MRTVHPEVVAWKAAFYRVVDMRNVVPDYAPGSPMGLHSIVGTRGLRVPVGLAIAVLCICNVVALVGCHGDWRESFYPSLAHADKDGAITRGWIPYFLPQSSTDIHEIHDLSPSTEWCAFKFLPADSEAFRKRLEGAQAPHASVKVVPSPGVSWWPDILTGKLDERKITSAGFNLYVLVEPATSVTTAVSLFAIDWRQGRGFFYSK